MILYEEDIQLDNFMFVQIVLLLDILGFGMSYLRGCCKKIFGRNY